MKRSRFTEDQIFAILKEADGGDSVKEVCRRHGIAPATYYQWNHAITVNIRGNSYRLKEKLKAGLVQPAENVT